MESENGITEHKAKLREREREREKWVEWWWEERRGKLGKKKERKIREKHLKKMEKQKV